MPVGILDDCRAADRFPEETVSAIIKIKKVQIKII